MTAMTLASLSSGFAKDIDASPSYIYPSPQELEPQEIPNAHTRFYEAMTQMNTKIISAYGAQNSWGSLGMGYMNDNRNVLENYNDIMLYLRSLLPQGRKIYQHADLHLIYGAPNTRNLIMIESSVELAQNLFENGDTASFDIRPPAWYTTEDLYNLIDQLYSGNLTFFSADGEEKSLVSKEFLATYKPPLALDLEVMLPDGGINVDDLNTIIRRYKEYMIEYGVENPIYILFDRGGWADMVDRPMEIDKEGLIVIDSSLGYSDPYKKSTAMGTMLDSYGLRNGGCMPFNAPRLRGIGDYFDEIATKAYINYSRCQIIMPQ